MFWNNLTAKIGLGQTWSMNKILVYGEMLWDVFPDIAVPGGATMNAAMGLRKLGADVVFMSGCGNDKYGDDLLTYHKENGMNTQWLQHFGSGVQGTSSKLNTFYVRAIRAF